MTLVTEQYTEANRQEWDDFVNHHPEGRFSHLIGYKQVIEKTYGYEPSYWLFRDSNGEIKAIFPSFVKRSWLLGNKLVSQPFSTYGGLLGGNLTEGDNLAIKQKLRELIIQHKVPFLEVRGGTGLLAKSREQIFSETGMFQYAVLSLSSSKETWEGKIDRMVRKAVRKAQRAGLECYQETNEESISKRFYPLYLRSMKNFGTPPLPLSFFLNCLLCLPDNMKLFLVEDRGETIGTLLGFTTGQRLHITDTASNKQYLNKRPNDLVHWEFIKWAADSGYTLFDFGPVRYTGQKQFKEKWGAESYGYSYFFLPEREEGTNSVLIYSKKVRLLASLWRRLIPLSLSGVIGPWFRKQLGD